MKKTVLIIDDEPDIRVLLKYNIEKEGFVVVEASNGPEGIEVAQKVSPDLILLDVMMPGMDGIETCEKIKSIPALENTIICFLTARGEDYSQLAGFEAGADDYIVKPIKPKILISKIVALFRRVDSSTASLQQDDVIGSLTLDREKYVVIKNDEALTLPRKEFELLSLLMSKPGKVFKRDEIMNRVWGTDVIVGDRTIDVHVRKLRKKIGDEFIETIKGVGYKFVNV
ncbi:response regulator transcription factor [Paracrocinitomix mangrovi]|uniref:response regulator transcription factor n=1 Tax=Paracrocinitomix mangrovi TaxID=2862509 RepID=UPI001C8E7FDD|nr:response regulator transcription factor [Paracrocinitomix mangrovi]UKN00930.1 response regulator transcription factor [Paracrocinitomix mangrovi]